MVAGGGGRWSRRFGLADVSYYIENGLDVESKEYKRVKDDC